jgi:hypothetical protein
MSKLEPELDEKIKRAFLESTDKYAAKRANMMKFMLTPGPWEFRMYAGGCTIVSAHDEPGTTVRARLKGVTVSVDAFIYDDQSNAAQAPPDARLIVASPDMLVALEATESR